MGQALAFKFNTIWYTKVLLINKSSLLALTKNKFGNFLTGWEWVELVSSVGILIILLLGKGT